MGTSQKMWPKCKPTKGTNQIGDEPKGRTIKHTNKKDKPKCE